MLDRLPFIIKEGIYSNLGLDDRITFRDLDPDFAEVLSPGLDLLEYDKTIQNLLEYTKKKIGGSIEHYFVTSEHIYDPNTSIINHCNYLIGPNKSLTQSEFLDQDRIQISLQNTDTNRYLIPHHSIHLIDSIEFTCDDIKSINMIELHIGGYRFMIEYGELLSFMKPIRENTYRIFEGLFEHDLPHLLYYYHELSITIRFLHDTIPIKIEVMGRKIKLLDPLSLPFALPLSLALPLYLHQLCQFDKFIGQIQYTGSEYIEAVTIAKIRGNFCHATYAFLIYLDDYMQTNTQIVKIGITYGHDIFYFDAKTLSKSMPKKLGMYNHTNNPTYYVITLNNLDPIGKFNIESCKNNKTLNLSADATMGLTFKIHFNQKYTGNLNIFSFSINRFTITNGMGGTVFSN
jgi:hypothetical protein